MFCFLPFNEDGDRETRFPGDPRALPKASSSAWPRRNERCRFAGPACMSAGHGMHAGTAPGKSVAKVARFGARGFPRRRCHVGAANQDHLSTSVFGARQCRCRADIAPTRRILSSCETLTSTARRVLRASALSSSTHLFVVFVDRPVFGQLSKIQIIYVFMKKEKPTANNANESANELCLLKVFQPHRRF